MKKIIVLLLTACAIFCTVCLCGCGGTNPVVPENPSQDTPAGQEEKTITGVSLANKEVTYDGITHSLAVDGNLPVGVNVTYQNNGKVNAGTYEVKAVLSGEGYKTLNLSAQLKINKADITGITLTSDEVDYDGKYHTLTVAGNLPSGVSVRYTYDGQTVDGVKDINNYTVIATLSGSNYNSLQLNAILKIRKPVNLINLASTVIKAFSSTPDPWQFLPDKLQKEEKILNAQFTYDNFVSVSSIPKNGIGKQLHCIYGAFSYTETALDYVNKVYAALSAVVNLYQEYINKNLDNYFNWEGSYGAFALKISISDNCYKVLAKASVVVIEMNYDLQSQKIETRVEITGKLAAKYVISEEHLRIAINVFSVITYDIELTKQNNNLTGLFYETTGVGSKRLTTSAIIRQNGNYFTVIGNKGDFIVPGQGVNFEIYSVSTGYLVGTEVYETVKLVDYETVWFNLYNIVGINSIKAEMGESNDKNPDTIYVNGSATPFVQEFNKKLGVKTSRQYDIEFKTMYFYMDKDGDGKLESVTQDIPMLFVQEVNLDSYLSDIKKNNSYLSTTPTNNISAQNLNTILIGDDTYLSVYQELKGSLNYEMTISYIGEKDEWFNK